MVVTHYIHVVQLTEYMCAKCVEARDLPVCIHLGPTASAWCTLSMWTSFTCFGALGLFFNDVRVPGVAGLSKQLGGPGGGGGWSGVCVCVGGGVL